MSVLTIASQKGGVGKTTVALNLGYALSARGWRTLIVDVDPQGALGLSLTPKVSGARGLVDHLRGEVTLEEALIRTRLPQLALLPVGQMSIDKLEGFENAIQDGALYRLIEGCQSDYDVIIMDTAPGFGPSTVGALCAATHLLAPLQAEPIALRSLPQLLELMAWLHRRGIPVKLLGVLLTMLQMRDQHSLQVAEEVWSRFPAETLLEPPIPRDPLFLKATTAGVPVGLLSRNPPPIARVFDRLAIQVEERLDLQPVGEDHGPIPLVD